MFVHILLTKASYMTRLNVSEVETYTPPAEDPALLMVMERYVSLSSKEDVVIGWEQ